MATALYNELSIDKKEIRVIQLEPAQATDDPLVASLVVVSLLEDPAYKALSYVCGDVNNTKPMTMSGEQINIYSNLDQALRHVRSTNEQLTLWVDQLSINQNDLTERGHQVRRMALIYSSAVEVLVHINMGPFEALNVASLIDDGSKVGGSIESDEREGTDSTNPEIEALDLGDLPENPSKVDILANYIHAVSLLGPADHWTGSKALHRAAMYNSMFFNNEYWDRLWTAQELILAKRAVFYLDRHTIAMDSMDAFFEWHIAHMGADKCCQFEAHRYISRHSETMFVSVDGCATEIREFRHRNATLLHDKVFAMAGLVPIPDGLIDYSLTPRTVFEKATLHIIDSTGTLDAMNHVMLKHEARRDGNLVYKIPPPGTESTSEAPLAFPSWVPDWSVAHQRGTDYMMNKQEGLMFNQLRQLQSLYSAAGTTVANTTYIEEGKLQVRGARYGAIAELGPCVDFPSQFKQDRMIYKFLSFAGVDLAASASPAEGPAIVARENAAQTLAGGLSILPDGGLYFSRMRDDLLRNEFLFAWLLALLPPEHGTAADEDRYLVVTEDMLHAASARYEQNQIDSYAGLYHNLIELNSFLRRLVKLDSGALAWVPHTAVVGDLVCVLTGGRTPFVLGTGKRWVDDRRSRPKGQGEQVSKIRDAETHAEVGCFQLVGDAYVADLMDGEWFAHDDRQMEDFILV